MPILSIPISAFSSVKDTDPTPMVLAWPGDLDEWREVAQKEDAPLWSPVTYRDGGTRTKNATERSILSVSALVLDYDGAGGVTVEGARAAWSDFEHAIYTTHSHLLVRPPKYCGEDRCRVVLPLTRPVTVAEFRRVWSWAHDRATSLGAPFDPLADPGRLYYVPSHRPGAAHHYAYHASPDAVDPDVILALSPWDGGSEPAGSTASGAPLLVFPTSSSPVDTPSGEVGKTGIFGGIARAHQTEDLVRIEEQCAFMRHARADAATLPEPEWYAWLSIVVRCRDGDEVAHDVGSAHPGYARAETEDKLRRALQDAGPRTCPAIRALSPACRGCVLGQPAGATTSPVLLGRPDPAAATADEVRLDVDARIDAARVRAAESLAAAEAEVARLTIQEAQQRAVAQHARQFGTQDVIAQEVGRHVATRTELRDARLILKEAEKRVSVAQQDATRAKKLHQADPRILTDPLFTLDVKTGLPRSSLGNLTLILERDPIYQEAGTFSYNLHDDKLYYGGVLAADHVDTDINIDIERRYGFASRTVLVQEAIVRIAHARAHHPIRDYLGRLEWDGVDRIGEMLPRGFGAVGDADWLAEVGRKWLIGAVARIYEPGCQMDTMIVLTGPQGVGKSTGLRALAGSDWFADTTLALGDKDAYMQLAGRWFYEIAELDSFRRAENTRIKAFLTSKEDTFRPPFGRHVVKRPRQTCLVGSTNEVEFLNDPTGSRRFVPVSVSVVDRGWITANRDHLWAEAVVRYRAGEPWHYADQSAARLARESAPYQQEDPWEPLVHDWIVRRKLPTCTVIDALTGAVGVLVSQINRAEKSRMIAVLRSIGCEDYRPKAEDGVYRVRAFRVPAEILESNVIAMPGAGARAPAFAGSSGEPPSC